MDNIQEVGVDGSCARVLNRLSGQVVSISEPAFLQDLDIAQKRSLIHQEYQRLKNEFQDEVKTVLGEASGPPPLS